MPDSLPYQSSSRSPRRVLLALAAFLGLVAHASGQQSRAPRIEAIRVGFGPTQPGWVKLAAWAPVWVDVQVDSPPFQGTVELTVLDDEGTPSVSRLPIDQPTAGLATAIGYVRPGTLGGQIEATLHDSKGRRIGKPQTLSPGRALPWSTEVILSAGKTPGLEQLPALPKFVGTTADDRALVIAPLTSIQPDFRALDAVDVIVLAADEPGDLSVFRDGGGIPALRTWVEQGGHLVVSLGREWKAAAELLGDLLPATPTSIVSLTDVGAVENFVGNVTQPLRGPLSVPRLEPIETRSPAVLAATAATPIVLRSAYGFGRVTLTSINVAGTPFSDWGDRRSFWDKLIGLQGHAGDAAASYAGTRGALIQSASSDLAARMHQSQQAFPRVTLIPFGWVASLVAVYLLLIGPVDYFFLRRIAKRMELTWLTFPLIVLGTSALAYNIAHTLKGRTLMTNKLDLLDVDQTGGAVRGSTWMTLYSPGNHDYRVDLRPEPPDLAPASSLKSDAAAATTLSWFAPPDTGLAGLGRMALGNRHYVYEPLDHGARLDGLRVPIWSSKSLSGRWAGRAEGIQLLEADLRVVSGDRMAGVVRNKLSVPVRNAQLFYGKHVYELGNIRPGGIARVDSQRAEALARVLGSVVQGAESSLSARRNGASSTGDERRPEVEFLRGALFHDAMGSRAHEYPSEPLRRLDLTSQVVELKRPILVGEVDARASSIALEGGPSESTVSQSTVLRVILGLAPSPAPAPPRRAAAGGP